MRPILLLAVLASLGLALRSGVAMQEAEVAATDKAPPVADRGASSPPPSADRPPATITIARALDKITGRTTELELPQGRPVRFGTLRIVARHCESRPPEEEPETFAFLEIDDMKSKPPRRVFSGWMMASSPALHALEHPIYDVWVIACRTSAPRSEGGRR